jgi:hypothetical protein
VSKPLLRKQPEGTGARRGSFQSEQSSPLRFAHILQVGAVAGVDHGTHTGYPPHSLRLTEAGS